MNTNQTTDERCAMLAQYALQHAMQARGLRRFTPRWCEAIGGAIYRANAIIALRIDEANQQAIRGEYEYRAENLSRYTDETIRAMREEVTP